MPKDLKVGQKPLFLVWFSFFYYTQVSTVSTLVQYCKVHVWYQSDWQWHCQCTVIHMAPTMYINVIHSQNWINLWWIRSNYSIQLYPLSLFCHFKNIPRKIYVTFWISYIYRRRNFRLDENIVSDEKFDYVNARRRNNHSVFCSDD
jgi:hypothetical protein